MTNAPLIVFVDDDADAAKAVSVMLYRHVMSMYHSAQPEEAFSFLAPRTH